MDASTARLSVSVVIPVYNSERILPLLMGRLHDVLAKCTHSFEVILVNDGSQDHSWDAMLALAKQSEHVCAIDLMRNYGQHNALLAGIRAAKHDTIVTMDDDLQNPPEEIPKLLDKLAEGYDVVYATPQKEQHGFLRNVASRFTKLVLRSAMGVDIARNVSAFRAFRTQLRGAFANYKSPFLSIDVLLTWGTVRFASVSARHDPRSGGASQYTFRKLMVHALNMITGFSAMPLQLVSLLGFLFTFFGLGVLVYVVGRYLIEGGSVPGFPFLASIIAIFSGAQLFALGIIGEYLARMHFRTIERPVYAIRRHARGGDSRNSTEHG
jgi:undecaprenyl-phosphate 4-deoxy-4-formamido-L-arabinose transferase